VSQESAGSMLRLALVALTLTAAPPKPASAQNAPLFIEHVAVVDVIAGRLERDMTVEIRGRTIAAMSAGGRIRAPRLATVIDGRGKYLIPGLWDMHVHSDAGQRSMEHLTEVDIGTSSDEPAIKAEELEAMNQKHGYIPDPTRLKSTFDSAKAASLFERFRQNDTWQVPTLVVFHQERQIAEPGVGGNDSLLVYIPKLLRDYWHSLPTDIAVKMVALYAIHADLVGRLNRTGVPILAGSDCPNPFVYPGSSLHDELGLLVNSGLTPAQALRTATINPARFLGVSDSLGTLAAGKVADLVLLDANPLDDIANTKRIRAVVHG